MEEMNLANEVNNDISTEGDAAISGISGFTLKMIAVVTMFIDHFAASILSNAINNCVNEMGNSLWITQDNLQLWSVISEVLRGIGRMAFPIYIFLLVEGFTYTRNKAKYAGRLALFALISEIPFDMAFNHSILETSYNNVFFTLLIGLLTIIALDFMKSKMTKLDASKSLGAWLAVNTFRCILMCTVVIIGMALAFSVFACDYSAAGVAAIVAMYLLSKHRELGFAACCIMLGLMCSSLEYLALLMLIPVHFYNGTRGKQIKYFFYAFYPCHLLFFVLIAKLLHIY